VIPGTPIVRLAALERVWLRVYVSETELGRIKLGQRAGVTVDTYPGRIYRGRVIEIAQQAEFTPKTVQTKQEREKLVFGVKVEVENPEHDLKPGMPADGVIDGRRARRSSMPAAASRELMVEAHDYAGIRAVTAVAGVDLRRRGRSSASSGPDGRKTTIRMLCRISRRLRAKRCRLRCASSA
jgi:hypothetical protein